MFLFRGFSLALEPHIPKPLEIRTVAGGEVTADMNVAA